MAKKMKVTLAGGTYTRQGKVFKAGDKLDVTQDEFERFAGKFNPVGAAPAASGDAAAAVKRAEAAEADLAKANARVAELEAELSAAKELKTTPESDDKGKDGSKAKGK